MKTLGNVMCVLNEVEFIEAAIESVLPGVDQLIVIDQGSTDGTRELLTRKYPKLCVISTLGETFLTRGEQFFRNLAISLCFCDWLMVTDGDEIMGDGWEKEVRKFMEVRGDTNGAIRGNYWQMIGSSEFHTPGGPLRYEAGERPLFYRMHDKLRVGDPMAGTKVHCSFENIHPPNVARLDIDCFHMGYAKNPKARCERNITRGDWTTDETKKKDLLDRVASNPLQFLPPCVPLTIAKERLPASIREPRAICEYDPVTRMITRRHPIP